MKTIILHRWDQTDPLPMAKLVEEAFNRVMSFCPELLETAKVAKAHASAGITVTNTPQRTAFNRVTNGEFSHADLITLLELALGVGERITERYPAGHEPPHPVAESIHQAKDHVMEVMLQTIDYVKINSASLK